MELVQVAIIIAIAIVVGLIFRSRIEEFVENEADHDGYGDYYSHLD